MRLIIKTSSIVVRGRRHCQRYCESDKVDIKSMPNLPDAFPPSIEWTNCCLRVRTQHFMLNRNFCDAFRRLGQLLGVMNIYVFIMVQSEVHLLCDS